MQVQYTRQNLAVVDTITSRKARPVSLSRRELLTTIATFEKCLSRPPLFVELMDILRQSTPNHLERLLADMHEDGTLPVLIAPVVDTTWKDAK